MKRRTARGRHMILAGLLAAAVWLTSCGLNDPSYKVDQLEEVSGSSTSGETEAQAGSDADGARTAEAANSGAAEDAEGSGTVPPAGEEAEPVTVTPTPTPAMPAKEKFSFDETWTYADYSKIHRDPVTLWHARGAARKDIVVAVNAGHGCSGGESEQTLCHPDGSAKVTGGSTSAGATTATAINGGMTFNDGTREADAVLQLAGLVREELLSAGYDVLMIRDNEDTQLDNIARTVFANNCADCHISLHYDSTASDKGFFYIRVPDVASYKAMEPVASHWQQHDALGEAILEGIKEKGVPVFGGGSMALDLTQTSYSTVPSVDLEVGDAASDHSVPAQKPVAEGIAAGIGDYFRLHPVHGRNNQ